MQKFKNNKVLILVIWALNPLNNLWSFFCCLVEWKCITICCDPVSRDFFFCWRSPQVTTRDPFLPIDSSSNQSLHKLSRIAKTMSWNIGNTVFGYFVFDVKFLKLLCKGYYQEPLRYCETKKVITWKLTVRDAFFPAWISHLQSREAGYWFGYSGLCKLTIAASTVVFPQISTDFIIPTKRWNNLRYNLKQIDCWLIDFSFTID